MLLERLGRSDDDPSRPSRRASIRGAPALTVVHSAARRGKSWKVRPNIRAPTRLSTPVESRVEREISLQNECFCRWLWRRKSSLNPPAGRCYCRRRPTQPKERTGRVEHPNELTAESLWDDVAARLRGSLNEKTFRNWFSEVSAVGLDDDTLRARGPERLHARVDRGPLRRPDPRRREGRDRHRAAARARRAAAGRARRGSLAAARPAAPRRRRRSTRSTRSTRS